MFFWHVKTLASTVIAKNEVKKVKNHHWKEIPERGSDFGIAILRLIMRVGGIPIMRIVLVPVSFYYLLTHGTARRASLSYLSRLSTYCEREGYSCTLRANWWGVYRHIYSFAISMAEKYAAWSGLYASTKIVQTDNLEIPNRIKNQSTGLVLLASHLGNFDILIAFGAFDTTRRFHILIDSAGMQRFNRQRSSIMRHHQIVFHDVEQVGPETAVMLREAISEGEIVVVAADRLSEGEKNPIPVRLLGCEAFLPVGPWVISHLLACPTYAVFACREKESYRIIHFHISENVVLGSRGKRQEALCNYGQQYADQIEQVMLKYPEQWYNFFEFWA